MKKITVSLALLLVVCSLCLTMFSGCEIFYTNDRSDVALMAVEKTDDGLCFYLANGGYKRTPTISYERESGEFSKGELDEAYTFPEIVLDGKTTAHERLEAKEGYEALLERVFEFTVEDVEEPIHHALAYRQGDTIYGFCNVYSTAGFFTDGLDCNGIERAILFTYDDETDELTVVEELENSIILAFDGKGVIWYENKAYYGKKLGEEAVKICDDVAYDTGRNNFGRVDIYFGDGYCLLYLHHEITYVFQPERNESYDTYVLVTTFGEKIAEYTQEIKLW